jgi:transposase
LSAPIEKWIGVSKSTVDKVWKLHVKTGDCSATPYRGRKPRITPELREKIENTIRANSDITLTELIEELKLPIGVSRLSQILTSWKYSFKKRRSTRLRRNAKMSGKNVRNGRKTKKNQTRKSGCSSTKAALTSG